MILVSCANNFTWRPERAGIRVTQDLVSIKKSSPADMGLLTGFTAGKENAAPPSSRRQSEAGDSNQFQPENQVKIFQRVMLKLREKKYVIPEFRGLHFSL